MHSVSVNEFTAPEGTDTIGVFSYNTPNFYFKIPARNVYGGMAVSRYLYEVANVGNKYSFFYRKYKLYDSDTISANLFDPSLIITGQYWTSSRMINSGENSFATFGPLRVLPGTYKYSIAYNVYGSNSGTVIIVDENMNKISTLIATYDSENTYVIFTITDECLISLNASPSYQHMLALVDEFPADYVAYTQPKIDEKYIPAAKTTSIEKEDTTFFKHVNSANLFNPNGEIFNFYFMSDGSTISSDTHISQYIPFNGVGEYYFIGLIWFYGTTAYKIPLFDSNKNYLGNVVPKLYGQTSGTAPISAVISNDNIGGTKIAYIGYTTSKSLAATAMFVKSDKYPSEYIPYLDEWVIPDLTYHIPTSEFAFAETNKLKGKVVVFDGDSICDAGSEVNTGETIDKNHRGWAGRIIDENVMTGWNVGVGGGTITAELYSGTEQNLIPRHWLSRYIDTIYAQHPTLDYLILEGGTNDADLLRSQIETKMGTLNMTDWSGNYDDTTFTGALESLFYKALNYYPTTKIGFIVAQKMGRGNDYQKASNNRRIFFERAIEVCKKWGIPYINLWDDSPLNPRLDIYYDTSKDAQGNRDAGTAYIDGQHLTAIGYNIVTPKIEQWMRGL